MNTAPTSLTELLTDRDAVDLLIEVGLLTPDDIVTGRIEVHRTDRRNRNFRIRTADGSGFFVKQAATPTSTITLRNEAEVLGAGLGELSFYMPRMLHYDAERNIIVTELLPNWSLLGGGTKSLHDLVPQNLASVGQALAVVHRAIAPGTTREVHVPLGVSLYKPSLELYRNSSQGNVQLLAAVHSEGTLRDHLSVLHRSWQHSSFIHGDVKFDNIVSSECDGREISVLVDWEFSGQGDPRWDVGSAVGELLHLWLRDAVSRELGMCAPSENERRGARALEQARLLTTTLLESYYFAAGKPFDGTFPAECFGFAVARLLQTAYEVGQFRSDLDLYAVKAVQVAANIAARRDAVLEIFLDRGARA